MTLTDLRAAIQGRKTYIIAALIVAVGVCEGVLGIDLPAIEVGNDWLAWVLNGLGLSTLRAGISKAAPQ